MGDQPLVQNMMRDMSALEATKGVFIKQQFDLIELIGWEAKNRYKVFGWDGSSDPKETVDTDGETLLYMREESAMLERICCGPNRSLKMHVHQGGKDGPVIGVIDKNFSLQGCCVCRPTYMVNDTSGSQIARVEDPFRCCAVAQQIHDADDKLVMTGNGSCCQLGIFCPCCGDVVMNLRDTSGNNIGEIKKIFGGCGEIMSQMTNFSVKFPEGSSGDTKLMLVGAAMGLDLSYFEQKKN